MTEKKEVVSLTEEQKRLVEDNHNLIYGYINKYKLSDEVYDILAIGLCKAAMEYSENKGKFSTFAYLCMSSEMYHDWLYHNRVHRVSLNKIISYSTPRSEIDYNWKDKDYDSYLDYLTAPNEFESNVESIVIANELFNEIKSKVKNNQLIVLEMLLQGFKNKEIIKKLDCSKQNVDRHIKTIRDKMKKIIETN